MFESHGGCSGSVEDLHTGPAYTYCSTPHVAEGCTMCAGNEGRSKDPPSSRQNLSCSRRKKISKYTTERAEFLIGPLACYLAPGGQLR